MISDQRQTNTLLVVEDSDEDFEALMRAIRKVNSIPLSIHRCNDGDDAIDLLTRQGKYCDADDIFSQPDLIILDLNLPGTDGREVLNEIKQSEILKTTPVVILSTSSNPKDLQACYESGCNSYMLKPMHSGDLEDSVKRMLDYWFKSMVLPAKALPQSSNAH
jgi:CheY-like chemotaxis protein